MNNKDELREIVLSALRKCNGDKQKTRDYLFAQAEIDDDLMIAFAQHGEVILEALNEAQESTKH